jgi:hypothetical protein
MSERSKGRVVPVEDGGYELVRIAVVLIGLGILGTVGIVVYEALQPDAPTVNWDEIRKDPYSPNKFSPK